MKKNGIEILIVIVLLGLVSGDFVFAIEDKVDILLLNSYDGEYQWSEEILLGIRESLKASGLDYKLRVEYMDTKNISSESYFKELFSLYEFKYGDIKFDYILVSDDNAFHFFSEYGDALFPGVPLFFAGINNMGEHEFEYDRFVSGIVEETSFIETLDVIQKLNPYVKNLYFIVDQSVTGKATVKKILQEFDDSKYSKSINLEILNNDDLGQIKDRLGRLSEKTDAAIFSFYAVFESGISFKSNRAVTRYLSEASVAPLYGLWSFSFPDGIVGGKLISGHKHGEAVIEMLLDKHENPAMEPRIIRSTAYNDYMFDYVELSRYNLDIELLPDDSKISNYPEQIFEKYREVILGVSTIIILLVFYIIVLRFQVKNAIGKHKEIQVKVMNAEKISALSVIVNGIAHEMNTPIGTSITVLSFIKHENEELTEKLANKKITISEYREKAQSIKESLEILERALMKASELVNSFKMLSSSDHSFEKKHFTLEENINKILELNRSEIKGKGCKVTIDIEDKDMIYSQPGFYYQIFDNLVQNSLNYAFHKQENPQIDIHAKTVNNVLKIIYSDNGSALKETAQKIFEPFYTSNLSSEHSGLGMYAVYNIIKSEEGNISCDINNHGGLKFNIDIPQK